MSKVTKKHADIAAYWDGLYVSEDGSVGDTGVIRIIFPGEPSCWGCECDLGGESWDDATVQSHVERAHIVADSLGGKDEVSNLFLLCPRCHRASPDTSNRKAFFRWVYKQRLTFPGGLRSPADIMQRVDDELRDRGLPSANEIFSSLSPEKQEIVSAKLTDTKRVKEEMNGRVTKHFGESMDIHSLVIAITDVFLHAYTEAVVS